MKAEDISTLATIEKMVGRAGADSAELLKRAERVYDDLVDRIAEEEPVDRRHANALACAHPVGKRAIAAADELHDAIALEKRRVATAGSMMG